MKKVNHKYSLRKFNFNLSNRLSYTLIAIFIFAIVGVGVYAVAGTTPNPGHSLSQLQPCSDGETLKMSGTAWTCAVASGGGGSGNVLIQGTNPSVSFSETDATANNRLWVLSGSSGKLVLQAQTDAGSGGGNLFSFGRANEQIQSFSGSNSGVPWFIIDNNVKRVGIGTTTPNARLQVCADSACSVGNAIGVGNDVFLADLNTANTMGVYGAQNPGVGAIRLGENGPTISGSGGDIIIPGRLCVGASCAEADKTLWATTPSGSPGGGGCVDYSEGTNHGWCGYSCIMADSVDYNGWSCTRIGSQANYNYCGNPNTADGSYANYRCTKGTWLG